MSDIDKINDCCSEDNALGKINEQIIDQYEILDVADIFKTLGEPSRVKILCALRIGELCVNHIAQMLGNSQSATSHQLRILKKSRLIKGRRDGQQIYYSLDDDHIGLLIDAALEHLRED